MKVSPLGALFAIVVIGIVIEAVEHESKQAAYALVVLILLGIVTFNATAFTTQINAIIATVNARSKPSRKPIKRGGGGASFR